MIQLNIASDGIATLTINQIQRAMNVIDWEFVSALEHGLDEIAAESSITGVIVTSGKSSFVAGADLAIMADFVAHGVMLKDAATLIGRIGAVLRRLETLGKPVVGASTGTALGGGLEILLACHYRIAADRPGAIYGLPEVTLGLLPGAGGTQRLPRLIGMAKALPLMLSGRHFKTQEALDLGILNQIVPADLLLHAARNALLEGKVPAYAAWDQKGFRLPGGDSNTSAGNDLFTLTNAANATRTRNLQPAPKAIASSVYEGSRLPIDRALRIEQLYFAQLVQGSVAQAMIATLFFSRQVLEKAPGRPVHIARTKLTHIAVAANDVGCVNLKNAATSAGMISDGPADKADLVIGHGPGQLMARWYQGTPGDLPAVLELAPGSSASEELIARGFDLARQLGAVPILLKTNSAHDWPLGYVGACIAASLDAARNLVAAGASAVVVQNAALANGWPSLPLLASSLGQQWSFADASLLSTTQVLEALAAPIEAAQRCIARAAIDQGVVDAHAANVAAVLGSGFPRHLGGPLVAPEGKQCGRKGHLSLASKGRDD